MVLEIFAGTCRLSQACRKHGLEALSVDKDPKRSEQAPTFDLGKTEDYAALMSFVDHESSRIVHAHFAPSCGTASRAREKKIKGIDNPPKLLRSDLKPDRLDGLDARDQLRVKIANDAYDSMARMALELIRLGISVSIQNPANSLFGKTSDFFSQKFQVAILPNFTIACMEERGTNPPFLVFQSQMP